jgi:hypothetical protein
VGPPNGAKLFLGEITLKRQELSATYSISHIKADQIDQAYPLVSLVAPTLDLDGWRALCQNVAERRVYCPDLNDVVVAMNPRGYIQGLCVTTIRDHPIDGRLLDVPIVVITSAADEPGVASDILAYLSDLGRAENCASIRIWTSEREEWSRRLVRHERRTWDHGFLLPL